VVALGAARASSSGAELEREEEAAVPSLSLRRRVLGPRSVVAVEGGAGVLAREVFVAERARTRRNGRGRSRQGEATAQPAAHKPES
jgi:hypothetical protein